MNSLTLNKLASTLGFTVMSDSGYFQAYNGTVVSELTTPDMLSEWMLAQ